jgi:hypothetical protein
MPLFICGSRYWSAFGMPMVEYEILLDGVEYRCDADTLDRLYDGQHPDDLDLILVEALDD